MSELTPTAVVTGGSRGIGRTIALTLAAAGYQIFFTYVSRPEAADAVVAEIEAAGGSARAFRVDSADADQVAAFVADEVKGKVDLAVLVNNAGITRDGLVLRMKDEDFDKVLSIDLVGAARKQIEAEEAEKNTVSDDPFIREIEEQIQARIDAKKAKNYALADEIRKNLADRGVTLIDTPQGT